LTYFFFAESVKSLLGKHVKILLKNVVRLETKGDKTENRVLVSFKFICILLEDVHVWNIHLIYWIIVFNAGCPLKIISYVWDCSFSLSCQYSVRCVNTFTTKVD
jgi:hypothetical protein